MVACRPLPPPLHPHARALMLPMHGARRDEGCFTSGCNGQSTCGVRANNAARRPRCCSPAAGGAMACIAQGTGMQGGPSIPARARPFPPHSAHPQLLGGAPRRARARAHGGGIWRRVGTRIPGVGRGAGALPAAGCRKQRGRRRVEERGKKRARRTGHARRGGRPAGAGQGQASARKKIGLRGTRPVRREVQGMGANRRSSSFFA